jgi:hypothetical protein
MMDSEVFRTNDMGMVAWLRYKGHETTAHARDDHGTCWWTFRYGQQLQLDANTFTGGEALVDPKLYNMFYARGKSDFHQLIGPRKIN